MKSLLLVCMLLLCGCGPTIIDEPNNLKVVGIEDRSPRIPSYSYRVESKNRQEIVIFYIVTDKKFDIGDVICFEKEKVQAEVTGIE
jgi:hypothetical protein